MKVQELFEASGYGPGDPETWPKNISPKPSKRGMSQRERDDMWDDDERRRTDKENRREKKYRAKFDTQRFSDGTEDHKGKTVTKWVDVIDADDVQTAEHRVHIFKNVVDRGHSKVTKVEKDLKGPRDVRFAMHYINDDPTNTHTPKYKG